MPLLYILFWLLLSVALPDNGSFLNESTSIPKPCLVSAGQVEILCRHRVVTNFVCQGSRSRRHGWTPRGQLVWPYALHVFLGTSENASFFDSSCSTLVRALTSEIFLTLYNSFVVTQPSWTASVRTRWQPNLSYLRDMVEGWRSRPLLTVRSETDSQAFVNWGVVIRRKSRGYGISCYCRCLQ